MNTLLRFHPLYQDRVWGGRAFEEALGRTLPGNQPIGESWEVVDRPEAQSVIRSGPWKDRTLREAIREKPRAIMGPDWDPEAPFPILIKWLDCRERLSLQVHPPASVAERLGGEPKTENWLIVERTPGAQLIAGLKQGVTRKQFADALAKGELEPLLHHFPVAVGDSLFVPSGRLHAIDAGNLILEIQQNSDTTYRVYDWGRVGLDGQPRQLHVEQALQSILWDDTEPEPVRASPTSGVLADCDVFRIRRVVLGSGEKLELRPREQPRLISVVSGRIHAGEETLGRGDNALVPWSGGVTVRAPDTAIFLLTENFVPAGT